MFNWLTKRPTIQTFSLLALHSSWWGLEAKWLCNPVLSCHSCALSYFACPIGVLVHYPAIYHVIPFIAIGTVLLIGVIFGRLLCGWVCPFGFLQDLFYRVPTRKFRLPSWMNNIKYLVLILGVMVLPLLFGTFASFCSVCPAAALQVTAPNTIAAGWKVGSAISAAKLIIAALVILAAILVSRVFCRVICPIGALLAPLNMLSFWIIRRPREVCLECAGCDKACVTDVHPAERIMQDIPANRHLDCVVCHDCQTRCKKTIRPEKEAAPAE